MSKPWEETWELLPREEVWGSDLLATTGAASPGTKDGECFAELVHAFEDHADRGRLAAAAPELYRALEKARELLACFDDLESHTHDQVQTQRALSMHCDEIDRLLAKVRGEP